MTAKLRLLSVTDGYWRPLTVVVDAVVKTLLACIISRSLGERRVAAQTRTRVYAAGFKISQRTSDQVFTRQRHTVRVATQLRRVLVNAFISLHVATVLLGTTMNDQRNFHWLQLSTTKVPVLATDAL